MAPSSPQSFSAWIYRLSKEESRQGVSPGSQIGFDSPLGIVYSSHLLLGDFVLILEKDLGVALGTVTDFQPMDMTSQTVQKKAGPVRGVLIQAQLDPPIYQQELLETGVFTDLDLNPVGNISPLSLRQWTTVFSMMEKRMDPERFYSLIDPNAEYREVTPLYQTDAGSSEGSEGDTGSRPEEEVSQEANTSEDIEQNTLDPEKPEQPEQPGSSQPEPAETSGTAGLDHKTEISYDSPYTTDELSRSPIAQGLAVTLNHLYKGSREQAKDSFRIHLHGMWGSGKSTFMRLLSFALQPARAAKDPDTAKYISLLPEEDKASRDWVIVNFNAWKQQRLDPLWWSLYQTIYTETCDSLYTDPSCNTLDKKDLDNNTRCYRIQEAERHWRQGFSGPWMRLAMLGAIITILALLAVFSGKTPFDESKNIVGLVLSLFSIPVVIFNLYKLVERDPAQTSRQQAAVFAQQNDDPLTALGNRFKALVAEVEAPIMVYVDDLDRCNADYVIELLEVIQTVFNDSRVYYLIAADRRWVHKAYESVYPEMMQSIREPGKDMGSLFLEKIFQMEVTIPEISPEQKAEYFGTLLTRQKGPVIEETVEPSPDEITAAVSTTVEAMLHLLTQPNLHSKMREAVSNKAAVAINTRESQEKLEHFLEPFSAFLANNPRAIKRYINAYTMILTIALVLSPEEFASESNQKKLALWMIILTRWPSAVEEIRQAVRYGKAMDFEENPALKTIDRTLFEAVLEGKAEKVDEALDKKSIKLFLRLTYRL